VSNWTRKKLERLLATARIAPAVVQVEMHPLLPQKELREYCKARGIVVTAYSSLGSADSPFRGSFPNLLTDPTIVAVAQKHGRSAAQVLLCWCVQLGAIVLPKSVNPQRIQENLRCTDFTLDEADMQAIAKLDRHKRTAGSLFVDALGITEEEFWDHE
jgi:alcohol dehydrogenase (NADP+)